MLVLLFIKLQNWSLVLKIKINQCNHNLITQEIKEKGEPAPPELTRPMDHRSVENLSYAAADMHHKNKQTVNALNHNTYTVMELFVYLS